MPFEAVIRLSGIARPVPANTPSDTIHVRSFHWGVSQLSAPDGGSGSSAGTVQVQEFSFVKRVDATSPLLLRQCRTGGHLSEAVFTVRQARGDVRECLTYTFRDVCISAVRPGGSSEAEDDFPAEEISLSFADCALEYTSQGSDGRAVIAPIHSGWNAPEGVT
jgi:type VI secretion system secreted protein Hcp